MYSSHGLIWSCRKLYQSGDKQKLWTEDEAGEHGTETSTALIPCIPGLEMEPWHRVVEQYTLGETSLSSDKLVALAAVAQTYSQSAGGEYGTYLAGLWRGMMPRALMWHVQKGRSRGRPESEGRGYRAPSWSWASVDGPVSFFGDGPSKPFRVVRAETTLAVGSIPFGVVVDGSLVLDVNARRCAVRRIATDPGYLQVVDGPILGVLEDADDFWDWIGPGGKHVLLLELGYSSLAQFGLVLVEAAGCGRYRRVAVFKWPCSKLMEIDKDFFSTFERDLVTIV
ncbi:hypothetical protein VMCG_03299 [Cytospora schulzeri]|uniref:Heterokaryon incompatibility domain-containing protein n=1 Tax=Cytospora schulzeri TaxID=448051 RepID=A0A423WY58_9PEZI|nr:hypothetical protein VMCG_03299 [Valsa malicola]